MGFFINIASTHSTVVVSPRSGMGTHTAFVGGDRSPLPPTTAVDYFHLPSLLSSWGLRFLAVSCYKTKALLPAFRQFGGKNKQINQPTKSSNETCTRAPLKPEKQHRFLPWKPGLYFLTSAHRKCQSLPNVSQTQLCVRRQLLFFWGLIIQFRVPKPSLVPCFLSCALKCFPVQRGFESPWEPEDHHKANTYS